MPLNELLLAEVDSVSASGVALILPGMATATQKLYKQVLTGETLTVGDRVLVARISGSYVVIGKIAYS